MINSNEQACYIAHGDRVLRFHRVGATYQIDIWNSDGQANFHLGAGEGEVEALLAFLQSVPAK